MTKIKKFIKSILLKKKKKITYKTNFWNISLITNNTLIPRYETETIIEYILNITNINKININILELGVGSGCISIALSKNIKNSNILATDIKKNTIKTTIQNIINFNCKNISIINSNWFNNIKQYKKFDIIISNPPYVYNNIKEINYKDPKIAIFAKNYGFTNLDNIIKNSKKFLKKNGILILEHGSQQQYKLNNQIKKFFKIYKNYKDINNKNRICISKL